jgi:hypothetical protein
MKTIAFCILYFLLSNLAHAQSLREYSLSLPKLLSSMNVDQVGDLKIKDILKELEQVNWEVTQKAITVGSGKPRFACNYFVREVKVICNSSASSPAVMPLVTLHEGLGALGYLDENYEISSAISIHALTKRKTPIQGVTESLRNIRKRTKDEIYNSPGGGTSVGGGGDSVGVTLKTFAVSTLISILDSERLTSSQQATILEGIKRIMAASFENNSNLTATQVQIQILDGKELVLVPFKIWTWIQMNTTSAEMIRNLVEVFDPILTHFLKPR